MSADTMPCGCLGHVDHEDLCRYPALEAERDSLKATCEANAARLGRLETEIAGCREEARKERVRAGNSTAARKRAEAGSAEVARVIDAVLEMSRGEYPEDCMHRVREMLQLARQNNLGAALLEYVSALERVRDAAEPFRSACLHPEPWPGGDSRTELVLSCADVDALKGKQ